MPSRGDTQTLTSTWYDTPGGSATDPTGLTLTIVRNGAQILGPLSVPPVIRDSVGRYRYDWAIPNDLELGVYTAVWSGVLPGEDAASVGYETLDVTLAVPDVPDFPDSCWPVDTSCVKDWDDTIAVPTEEDPEATEPKYSDREKAYAVSLAGQTMRLLTAYRVGGCPITVRPCRAGCSERTWRTYPVNGLGFSGSTPWFPVNLGGTWLNIGCGHVGSCVCSRVSEVRLHGTPSSVTEVKVNGEVLSPSSYRLDPGGLLVRTDGQQWPLCQNLDAPDTEPDTWAVTYTMGAQVDGIGAIAAGRLAGEYVRACSGSDCDLPRTVTQIVRAGVSMTIAPGAFPNGKTGIRDVDAYIERWNPTGARGRISSVWSPDVPRQRVIGS